MLMQGFSRHLPVTRVLGVTTARLGWMGPRFSWFSVCMCDAAFIVAMLKPFPGQAAYLMNILVWGLYDSRRGCAFTVKWVGLNK